MRVSVINEDQTMVVDGQGLKFVFTLNKNIHAIQWYEDHGEIEYKDPSILNEVIEDFSPFQYLVDEFNDELLRIEIRDQEEKQKQEEEIILVHDELPVVVSGNTLWERIRSERNRRLAATDWTQLPDVKLTTECIQIFADYRQELRDIPQTYQAPDEALWEADTIHWPEKPEEVKKI